MKIETLDESFAICKLDSFLGLNLDLPFTFVANTDNEKSLVVASDKVPDKALKIEDGYRCFRICGELDFSLTGIISEVTAALKVAKIPVFALSTFDTDYFFIKCNLFEAVIAAIGEVGYKL